MPNRDRQPSFSAKSKRTKDKNTPPAKPKNKDVRKREYLTYKEVEKLRNAAKGHGRHGFRDYWLITFMYRHGLRVSEVCDLRWQQVDLEQGHLHVTRVKNGDPSVHFLYGDAMRALRRLRRGQEDSDFVFLSERGAPLSERSVHNIVARAGELAKLKILCHPHMLRHARGYKLAAKGEDTRAIQAYLGHKNIQHTVLYTKLEPSRFKKFGTD